ncbi:MAG: NTP transferase domain-containing protein, partial [Gemmatimonadota bacterium]
GETRLTSILAERGIRSVAKPGTEAGLGVSLRVGLEALAEVEPQPVSAALVFLADQPRVRGDVVAGLVAAWRSGAAAVVRPRYAGAPQEPGHPVLLDRSVWALANELAGDAGLRDVLRADAVVRIDVRGSNPDVDTRRDLDALRREG